MWVTLHQSQQRKPWPSLTSFYAPSSSSSSAHSKVRVERARPNEFEMLALEIPFYNRIDSRSTESWQEKQQENKQTEKHNTWYHRPSPSRPTAIFENLINQYKDRNQLQTSKCKYFVWVWWKGVCLPKGLMSEKENMFWPSKAGDGYSDR